MNFFEHQDRARRNTGWLIGLFLLALVGLVAGTYTLVMAIFLGGVEQLAEQGETVTQLGPATFWRPDILAAVSLAVGGVVGAGSLYKTAQLAGGGESVALMLGGRPLPKNASDPLERKVLHVV